MTPPHPTHPKSRLNPHLSDFRSQVYFIVNQNTDIPLELFIVKDEKMQQT